MGNRPFLMMFLAVLISPSLMAKEIVVGVERVPVRTMAFNFTPIVLPDLVSAKAAFEYRLHRKFNLVLPVEAKWMDYRWAISSIGKLFDAKEKLPQDWYRRDAQVRVLYNIDLFQFKISTGVGVKWFPFSEAMTNAFFVKTIGMLGFERLNAYGAEGQRDGAVLTHALTIGYAWVKKNRFTFGFELGEEYTWHSNPIEHMPILLSGFMPVFNLNLGFTI